jgi:hypothetical protein
MGLRGRCKPPAGRRGELFLPITTTSLAPEGKMLAIAVDKNPLFDQTSPF